MGVPEPLVIYIFMGVPEPPGRFPEPPEPRILYIENINSNNNMNILWHYLLAIFLDFARVISTTYTDCESFTVELEYGKIVGARRSCKPAAYSAIGPAKNWG